MPALFAKKDRIFIFGAGSGGTSFYKRNRGRYKVLGFIDNNSQRHGQQLLGKPILGPDALHAFDFDKILIVSDYFREIHTQLIDMGIQEKRIEIFNSQVNGNVSLKQRLSNTLWHYAHEEICRSRNSWSNFLFWLFYKRRATGAQPVVRMKLQWLDTTSDFHVHTFREALQGVVQGPTGVGKTPVPTPVTLPPIKLHRFENGRVASVSRSVALPDGRLVIERVTTTTPKNADYSVGHVIHHGDQLALVRDSIPEYIPKGILINGCSETNYYHWVVEVLSQLQYVAELPDEFRHYPLLISEHSEKIPSINALMQAFNIEHPVRLLSNLSSYQVADLLLITAPNNLIPNFKNSSGNSVDSHFARPESVEYLRQRGLSLVDTTLAANTPKRVFLARKGFVRRYNQDEIIELLGSAGFVPVYMEDLSVSLQIAIMANAEMVAGPTGAAWTNIIFASSSIKALCWMAEEYGDIPCFSNLASLRGVELEYITFPTGARDSRELYYKGYHLNVDTVRAWMRQHAIDASPS